MTTPARPGRDGAQPGGGPEAGRDPRFVRAILGVYPAWWRERYGEEFAALLLDVITGKPRVRRARLAVNAIGGGVHARLHLRGSATMPERVRWPVSAAACAFMVFAGTLAALAKMREGSVFTEVAHGHAAVGVTVDILQITAAAAILAMLAGGLPIGWVVFRQAVTEGRLDLIRPLVLAPAAVGGWLAAAWIIARLAGAPRPPAPLALIILALLGLAAAAVCAWSAITVIRRAALTPRLLRVEVVPMAILSACMTVATAADLGWGLAIRSASSALFHSDNGLVSTPLAPNWAATAVVLAVVTAVTVAATIRASLQFLPGARA